MRLKPLNITLTVMFSLFVSSLVSCVSINDRTQLVSDGVAINASGERSDIAYQSTTDVPACRVEDVKKLSADTRGLDPQDISLLNWNIYKGDMQGWQQDLSVFSQDHNLMTIQEATLDESFLSILEANDFSWTMNAAFSFNDTTAGVMNVANADAIHSCGYKVSEPVIRIPKAVLISYYAIEGRQEQLLVANIHGINFTLGMESYEDQLDQLDQVISEHDGPIILAGDFNTWSEQRLEAVEGLVKKLSLSSIEYEVNNKTHIFGNALDHVFYRQLQLVSNSVIDVSSSDHNPISVRFRIN